MCHKRVGCGASPSLSFSIQYNMKTFFPIDSFLFQSIPLQEDKKELNDETANGIIVVIAGRWGLHVFQSWTNRIQILAVFPPDLVNAYKYSINMMNDFRMIKTCREKGRHRGKVFLPTSSFTLGSSSFPPPTRHLTSVVTMTAIDCCPHLPTRLFLHFLRFHPLPLTSFF
jgi:hypothetical protein